MLEVQTKAKRQIEILGLALANAQKLKDVDFAVMFGRDVPTIKRDMQELRGLGIPLHSEKKKGLCVTGRLEPRMVRELILQYLGICNSTSGIDKATALLVKKQKDRALSGIVSLQRCIEQCQVAIVDYQKDEHDIEKGRELQPLVIFSSEGYWRVLAVNDGKVKQYLLNKIVDIRPSDRKFKRIPQQQIDEMFQYSFRSWVGSERHQVKIHLSKKWGERLKVRQMMEAEIITENDDGSVVFETIVNSLTEIASWTVSRGEGVTVLEPPELKAMVVQIAKGALGNYQ